MPRTEVDHLVVGAGVLGLSAAWSLARRGRSVLVVERATVGHERSGSKGTARIFRLGYPEPRYVAMAQAAERGWRRLEDEVGRSLLATTGQVTFGEGLGALAAALGAAGAPVERLPAGSVAERWPGLSVPGPALFEAASGVLAADRCLAAFGRGDFELAECTAVATLADDGRRVTARLVPTQRAVTQRSVPQGAVAQRAVAQRAVTQGAVAQRVVAQSVVVCAGAESGALVGPGGPRLALTATLEQVAHLASTGTAPTPPVFVEWGRPALYGLPEPDGRRYKIAFHGGGPPVDPSTAPLVDDPAAVARLRDAARRVLPGQDPDPVATERCLYDNSADTDFVLDRIGRVVVGAGTSGHGFKFAPLLGEVLADLATGVAPGLDLGPFGASRPAVP